MVAEVRFVIARGHLIANGLGHTVNMSSTGLLLESEHALPVGRKITLSVAWPALLNGEAGLTLRVKGRTIRMQGRYTAVQILSYDFRTRRRAARKEDEARSQVITPRRQVFGNRSRDHALRFSTRLSRAVSRLKLVAKAFFDFANIPSCVPKPGAAPRHSWTCVHACAAGWLNRQQTSGSAAAPPERR